MRMVCITAGRYPDPEDDGDWLTIDSPFWISDCEVAVAAYLCFVKERESDLPVWMDESSSSYVRDAESEYFSEDKSWILNEAPITGISHEDAEEFCRWLSDQPGEQLTYSLPSREHWQCAYSGGREGGFYWGSEFDAKKCNTAIEEDGFATIAPVGRFAEGHPWGLSDMAGNVWEMVRYKRAYGGAWNSTNAEELSVDSRTRKNTPAPDVGFRLMAVKN